MARIVKTADVRRMEFIKASEELFRKNGFAKTSVEMIIKEIGVAKGTFYYYFRSKEDVLKEIVDLHLNQIVLLAEQVAADDTLDVLAKMKLLLGPGHRGYDESKDLSDQIHLPGNRELNEETNIQTILRLSPIFARIIEQGNQDKIFDVEHPLETFQLLLSSAQFLLDGGLFDFSYEEKRIKQRALQDLVEKGLGAEKGTFHFLIN